MIEAFKRFLDDLTGKPEAPSDLQGDIRLAVAALMFHTIAVDGSVTEEERELLRTLLSQRFELDDAATHQLVTEAGEADAEAVDLYSFTSVLKQNLEIEDRERIVGMMWRLVYADGELHEFEDNVIWRVAELLGVSTQSRIRLKQAARDD